MTEDERIEAEVKRRIEQRDATKRDVSDIVAEKFQPMDRFIAEWTAANLPEKVTRIDGKVDTLTTVQRTQGREIGELKDKVDKLDESMTAVKERVAAIPGERAASIQKHVDSCRKERDQASGLVNTAEEQGRAEAERIAEAYRGRSHSSVAPSKRSNPVVKFVQTYLLYILIGLAALGSGVAALGNGNDEQQFEQAAEKTEDVSEQVEALRQLLESVATHPPVEYDHQTGQPVSRQDPDAGPQ